MAYHFRIGDISHFFDIPASTLRYWENMGVLTPKKDQINNYREYTVENLMSISDVIFYKNLGLPLKNIRQMENMTPEQHYHLFEKKMSELQQQQIALQQRMERVRCHMQAIQTLKDLRENPYQDMDIDTDCIVSFELIERDKLRRYIENPYLYSRVQHSENMQLEQRGITIVKSDLPAELLKEQIIWEKKNNNRYITFLMKEEITEGFPNDLQRQLQMIQQKYQTGAVISRFLVCAQEEGKIYDFYKTFVEII